MPMSIQYPARQCLRKGCHKARRLCWLLTRILNDALQMPGAPAPMGMPMCGAVPPDIDAIR